MARMAASDAPGRWFHLASVALLGGAVFAAPRPGAADETHPLIVLVVEAGDAGDDHERAAMTIAAHVRPLGVELAVVHEGAARSGSLPYPTAAPAIAARSRQLVAERHACGVLWVGAGSGDLALFLYAREGDRLFERRVPAARGQTSAAIEALALIAHSASAELLEGKVAVMNVVASSEGAPPEPAATTAPVAVATAPPAPEPTEAAAPRAEAVTSEDPPQALRAEDSHAEGTDRAARRGDASSAALAAGYVGNTAGRSIVWQSAFAVEAGWHPMPRATLGLGYEFALPDSSTAGGPGAAQSHRHPLFGAAGYRVLFLPRWDLELGGRAVVDFITTSDGRMFASTSTDVRASLGPTADLGLRILPPLRLGLRLGVDVMLDSPSSMSGGWSASDQLRFAGGLGLQLDLDRTGTSARPPPQDAPRITASR
jgi:hypothetical protein